MAVPNVLSKVFAAMDRASDYVGQTLKRASMQKLMQRFLNFLQIYSMSLPAAQYGAIQQSLERITDSIHNLMPTAPEMQRGEYIFC